jgi:tetratricopeptide (TPR) repeat protein
LGFGEPDLPVPAPRISPPGPPGGFGDGFGELDLPLAASAGLPAVASGHANLPSPANPYANLPATADPAANLPSSIELGQQLPTPIKAPPPMDASADDLFGTPPPRPSGGLFPDGMPPAPPPSQAPTGFGSFPPIGTGGLSGPPNPDAFAATHASGPIAPQSDAFGSLPPVAPVLDPAITRQAGGGVAFGEVNLNDDEGAPPADVGGAIGAGTSSFGERNLAGGEDDMEFGNIPQEEDGAAPHASLDAAPAPLPAKHGASDVALPAKKSKTVKILLAGLLVALTGGIALSATPFGAFGTHFISDTINSGRHASMLEGTVQESRGMLAVDTADQADASIAKADDGVTRAPRLAALSAYAAFIGYQREIRFGLDSAVHAHSNALLTRAAETDKEARHLDLARAAQAVADGEIAKARQAVQDLVRLDSNDIDAAVLEGEVELRAKEYKNALAAWERAAALEKSARTSFGQARAYVGLGDTDKARAFAEAAMAQTKNHVGGRILLADLDFKAGKEEKAAEILSQIVGPKEDAAVQKAASRTELVSAHTLSGRVHLTRSRMSSAEASFAEALKLDPKDADALCGFGEVLYREGRYAEALARFEAGMQADAQSVPAKIGAAKTRIALERLQEAKEILRKLRETRPSDPVVAFWLAKVEEALGNKPEVEKILVDAIGRDPKGADAINLYVALAQFLAAQGRMQEADEKLAEARRKLPDSPAIRKALGSVALAAGRLNEAKGEFEIALQQDGTDLSSLFHLAVTLRRMGRFEDAQEKFDKVSTADKNYPGLALERGVLFEASGQAQRALEMYQEALSKAPNDPDLMLRVGSAEVAAGHATQAEEILRKVLRARPNSAEANHYLGRAQLLKGTNLAEALRFLRRAAEIDPNRAEYWLFIGWAANEAGQPGTAEKALEKALELDQSLADAYWQRGILLRRQGTVRDAERDLLKALELKPSRFEAHATLAECYEDQSKWGPANAAWRRAIEADGNRPFWRYKLGRLQYNAHDRAGAAEQLKRAVQLAAKETRPAWLWEAYLMLAEVSRTGGRRAEAIEYYREYLKLAPPDSPFRPDALKQLAALGASPDEQR